MVAAATPAPAALLEGDDVTVARATAAALRASETRYRRLFETAQDGVR